MRSRNDGVHILCILKEHVHAVICSGSWATYQEVACMRPHERMVVLSIVREILSPSVPLLASADNLWQYVPGACQRRQNRSLLDVIQSGRGAAGMAKMHMQ